MLTLYSDFNAVCGQKVSFLLEEKQVDFNYQPVNLRAGEQHSEAFLKLNPLGQVPVLVHNDKIICESSLICHYIEHNFKPDNFSYVCDEIQSTMTEWMDLIDSVIHSACSILTWSIAIRPEMLKKSPEQVTFHFNSIPDANRRIRQERAFNLGLSDPKLTKAIADHVSLLNKMEIKLGKHKHLVDDSLSLADICVLPYIVRLEMLSLEVLWNDKSNVKRWLKQMRSRAAFTKTFKQLYPRDFLTRWKKYGDVARVEILT